MKFLSVFLGLGLMAACASSNCREMKDAKAGAPIKKENDPMNKSSAADRAKIFKPDGSLQCGQGKATPPAEMQKELGTIKVHSAGTRSDGMMRIQLCGSPTGNNNVYEIDRKDLEAALKLGFREWTAD